MIAPEVSRLGNGETGRRALLRKNLFAATLIFFALQFWRPFFFLTDDNLDGGYPFFTEMGRHLLAGRSPFFSDYLFGGHYNLLRDPTFFAWHPLYLLSSLLTGTPWHFAMIDVAAFCFFMLAVAGFVNLAWYLRRELALPLGDGWIMFYTLSFAYSMFVMTTGASWLNFLGAQSALPWLTLGILQRSWKCSLALIFLFCLHQILGSHLEPAISNTVFLSIFAAGVAWIRRSWQPLLCWGAGYALAAIVLLPFLVPLFSGFLSTDRAHGVDVLEMTRNNIPMELFPTSILVGMALWMLHRPEDTHVLYTLALGSSAAAWCVVARVRFQPKRTPLEWLLLLLLALTALVVCRPVWVSDIMVHLPLLKAMRWPFRELLQFLFFLHLFFVVRAPGGPPRTYRLLALFSVGIFVAPMLAYEVPPTLNTMATDRALLFSGGFDDYWKKVRPLFQPGDRVAVLIPLKLYDNERFDEPFSLLSAFNYPCLTGVVSASGYSQTPPSNQLYCRTPVVYHFGAWAPEQKAALLAERPDLKFITLESLNPVRLSLSSRTGPTIDLTPFLPAAVRGTAPHR